MRQSGSQRYSGLCAEADRRPRTRTVIRDISFDLSARRLLDHPDNIMKEAARQALIQVGLTGKENANYMHLSEGQKQLCILAHILVLDSKLLFRSFLRWRKVPAAVMT